jgi:hypothetical protein
LVAELANQGVTVFLTTHYMEEADQLCHRVAFLDEGRIVALDTPQQLKVTYGQRLLRATLDDGECLTLSLDNPDDGRRLGELAVAGRTELRSLAQIHLLEVDSAQGLMAGVEKNAVGGLALPANFDAAMDAGEQPEITVYLNRRRGGGELVAMTGQAMPARIVWTDVAAPPGLWAEGAFRLDLYRPGLQLAHRWSTDRPQSGMGGRLASDPPGSAFRSAVHGGSGAPDGQHISDHDASEHLVEYCHVSPGGAELAHRVTDANGLGSGFPLDPYPLPGRNLGAGIGR